MEKETKDDAPDALDGVREMPKWVSRYAHNRTLSVLALLGLNLLAIAVIGESSTLAGREGQAGHKAAALALCAVSLAACVAWIWLVLVLLRSGRALSDRLYDAEGIAVAATKPCGRSSVDRVVPIAFGLCVALSVAAGFAFESASRYMVPIMTTYMVPFLLYIWARQGGMAAPFMLLWPGLLLIHAVLALAGVHPFSGEPNSVSILVPIVGYGAIAALASHVYSRVALRRLRSLARGPATDKPGGGQHA